MQDVPRLFCSDTDPDDDFEDAVPDPRAVVEMIGEYARHMGHADLLREQIDGRTGQ